MRRLRTSTLRVSTILALSCAILIACSSVRENALVPQTRLGQASRSPHATASPGRHLHVANASNSTVTEYEGAQFLRTIPPGLNPRALAFDASGNLYVANNPHSDGEGNTVTVYAPGSTTAMQTISQGLFDPTAIAVDASGNLYVANRGAWTVTVYAPGSTSVLRTISYSDGISYPVALAFDGAGNLYVANQYEEPDGSVSVTVYAPGGTSPLRKISQGMDRPQALAFDNSGNLYVANLAGNTITVYAPGSTSVLRTISQGVYHPAGLAFDASGNLYVSNTGGIGSESQG